MKRRIGWVLSFGTILLAGCGGGSNTPMDGGNNTPTDGSNNNADGRTLGLPPRTIENPGEPAEDPLPEQDMGSVNEGTDAVGSCIGPASSLGVGPAGSRSCIDYNSGFDADSALAHCMGLGTGGQFRRGQACDTANSYLVDSCTRSETDPAAREMRAYFYRYSATRMEQNPPDVTQADVSMWCSSNGWTPPMSTVPMNTGRCQFSTTVNFLGINGGNGVRTCVNFDQGYTMEDATTYCTESNVNSTAAPTLALGESCVVSNDNDPGCRYTSEGRTRTVRHWWGYRNPTPWTAADFQMGCELSGGTYFTGR